MKNSLFLTVLELKVQDQSASVVGQTFRVLTWWNG